MNRPKALKKNS